MIQFINLVLILSFFSTTSMSHAFAAARANEAGLTWTEAQIRGEHLKNISYQLQLDIRPDLPNYRGIVTSQFQYQGPQTAITVDFEGGTVLSLSINGKTQDAAYNGHFLTLPADKLKVGANEIKIEFNQLFAPAARGLYRFKDPEDGRIYLYTDFEPYFANRFFPCFDQPDLKAKLKLKATVPSDWQVVSTTIEESKGKATEGYSEWTFPETPAMSSYLFSLHAGPYQVWKDNKRYPVPLRLFARQSLAKYIDPEFWFTITRQGLDYYNDYFDFPYPFKKYDQIIVPDFNAGAMENIAAITFSERFVSRGKMTNDEKQSLADVILHEMAHQWFGNLVTMKWWSDLWLNESFATFMASQALVEATEYSDAWLDFSAYSKRSAYYEDQLVTTHPIATRVDDTETAMNNFDGITYGKGASALKQLAYAVGPDAFRDGVRAYLKNYQYKNATLADFLASLQEKATKFDAKRWSREWLEAAGLNSIQAKSTCVGNKLKSLELLQSSISGEKILRQHTAKVALFTVKSNKLTLQSSARVTYDGASTIVHDFDGQACPSFVLPNLEDQDFAQIELVGTDLGFVLKHIGEFPSAELRVILWQALSQMVRDGKIKPQTYFDLILAKIPNESSYTIKDLVLASVGRRSNLLNYLATPGVANSTYAKYIAKLEKLTWTEFKKAAPGTDEQVLWFENYRNFVESKAGLAQFAQLLKSPGSIPKGFVLDQDLKWDIVGALARMNAVELKDHLTAQEKADPSRSGKLSALAARTASADTAEKRNLWNQIIDEKTKYSEAELKAIMGSFFPRAKLMDRRLYAKDFYAVMNGDLAKRDSDWLRNFTGSLRPLTCTAEDLKVMKDFVAKQGDKLPPAATKPLLIGMQEDERCILARKKS